MQLGPTPAANVGIWCLLCRSLQMLQLALLCPCSNLQAIVIQINSRAARFYVGIWLQINFCWCLLGRSLQELQLALLFPCSNLQAIRKIARKFTRINLLTFLGQSGSIPAAAIGIWLQINFFWCLLGRSLQTLQLAGY